MPTSSHDGGSALIAPTWVRWRVVALLMAYSFMSWFNRVSMPVADVDIMDEYQLTPTQIGNISSAFLLAYMLCMTPGGWFIDRFGARLALVAMGFGSALFGAITGLAGHAALAAVLVFPMFLIIRALMGGFTAPIYPGSAYMIGHWISFSRRAWANGLVNGAAPLGIACSHVVFGFLLVHYGWRMSFAITGIVTAVVALLWTWYATDLPAQHRSVNPAELSLLTGRARLLPSHCAGDSFGSAGTVGDASPSLLGETRPASSVPQDRVARASQVSAPWQALLLNRSLVLLTLSYAAVGYFEYLFFFSTEYYFKKVLQFEVDESRWYAAIASLSMAVTMPLGGWFSDLFVRMYGHRTGRALMPVIGMIGSALSLYAAILYHERAWVVTWFTLAHAAIGAVEGSFWTTAIELGGRHGGTAAGILNTGGNAGGMLAPSLTPWVGEHYGWDWGMKLGCLICLLGACQWLWIDPARRSKEEDPSSA